MHYFLSQHKRALKAKQQHQENLENRKKLAELKLAQMKTVEENRLAKTQAISEKAKQDLEKVIFSSFVLLLDMFPVREILCINERCGFRWVCLFRMFVAS